jgi:hypothetical protein
VQGDLQRQPLRRLRQQRQHGVLRRLLWQYMLRLQEANQQGVRGRLLRGRLRRRKIMK